jgi:hypothetical protein
MPLDLGGDAISGGSRPPPSITFSMTWGGAFTTVRLRTFGVLVRGFGTAAGRVRGGSVRRLPRVFPPGVAAGFGTARAALSGMNCPSQM